MRTTLFCAFMAAGFLVVACDKKQEETAAPDPGAAARSAAEKLNACPERIDAWVQVPNKPPEDRDPDWAGIQRECGALYKQCGGAPTTVAFVRGGNRGLVLDLAGKCIASYCGGFASPKPALCDGGTKVITTAKQEEVGKASEEFHKAMLTADLGDGDWTALTGKLGELWQGYGEVDLGGLGAAEALGFKVWVTAAGFDLRSASPQKWIARDGLRSTGITIELKDGEWDYEALAKEVRALKMAHPEESTVTLVVDDAVPNDVQVKAMDALRGEGCTLEADASPSSIPSECLFWRQILQ